MSERPAVPDITIEAQRRLMRTAKKFCDRWAPGKNLSPSATNTLTEFLEGCREWSKKTDEEWAAEIAVVLEVLGELCHQIEIGEFVDPNGHGAVNLQALFDAKRLLDDGVP